MPWLWRSSTLREYLELVKNQSIITNIEMKTGVFEYLEMEQMLVDMLREYKVEDLPLPTAFGFKKVRHIKP